MIPEPFAARPIYPGGVAISHAAGGAHAGVLRPVLRRLHAPGDPLSVDSCGFRANAVIRLKLDTPLSAHNPWPAGITLSPTGGCLIPAPLFPGNWKGGILIFRKLGKVLLNGC